MFDTCPPLKHLMIGVPEYDGTTTSAHNHGMINGVINGLLAGVVIEPRQAQGCCYLDLVRNDLVRQFLESEADRLLFIDADVGAADEDAVLKVANTIRPVVAGVYPKKKHPPAWPVTFAGDTISEDPKTGLVEAAQVATGFLCIHRDVFEAMKPHVPVFMDDRNIEMYAFFQTGIHNGRYRGEDFFFCDLWRSLGGKVWIQPDITFRHTGSFTWEGNYKHWFMSRKSWDKIEGFNNCPNLYTEMVVRADPGARFVEVGTWKGRSAAFMAELIQAYNKRILFDVVDTFEGSPELADDPDVRDGTLRETFDRNVAYIRDCINDVHQGKSVEVSTLYPDESLDFVFIDAAHDTPSVIADCLAWWPKIKPGGCLAGDDWQWDSVRAGVTAFFESDDMQGDFTLEMIDAGWCVKKP